MEQTLTKRPPNGQLEISEPKKLPTLAELITEDEGTIKQNHLMVLLNQEPPKQWVKEHPMTKQPYMPAERVEYLLSRIFSQWWIEIKDIQVIANSCVVTVRLYVINPTTKEVMWNEGVGACPIQTDKGAAATDWNKVKAAGVQMAAPAAKTYAFKDAAESFGKLFGKDLARAEQINYTDLLKPIPSLSDLQALYEVKKEAMSKQQQKDAERIINEVEVKSFPKLHKCLMEL